MENIKLFYNDNISSLEICDYLSANDFLVKKKIIDSDNRVNISTNILWNTDRQCVDKGVYYVIFHNDMVYNILVNDEYIKIDEMTKVNDGSIENILTVYKEDNHYFYASYKHDVYGSTHGIDYYDNQEILYLANLLSKEEVISELYKLVTNMHDILNLKDIVDMDFLNKVILGDLLGEANYQKVISEGFNNYSSKLILKKH